MREVSWSSTMLVLALIIARKKVRIYVFKFLYHLQYCDCNIEDFMKKKERGSSGTVGQWGRGGNKEVGKAGKTSG